MKKQSILVWIVVMTAGTSVYSDDWQLDWVDGENIPVSWSWSIYPSPLHFHVDAPHKTLTILNPNGDERLLGGSIYTIRWEDSGSEGCGGNYLLDYSIDDANNWIPVDSNPVSNTCSYDWLVPSIFSNQCLIRITDADDPNASDTSDDSFRIYRCMSDVLGDWNGDCYIDFGDFSIIAAGWNVPGGTDMNDLAGFVQYWLDCANPYDPYCCNFGEAQPDYPSDGAVIPGDIDSGSGNIWTELTFIPGPTAVEHTGYFNEDYSKVASRHADADLGPPPYPSPPYTYWFFVGTPVSPDPRSLVRGTTYYWTVDAEDALGNTFPGEIWEFTIQDFKATLPNPPNEATFVETDVLLSWQPGYYRIIEHDVFMGTSWEDVNNAVYNFPATPPPEYLAFCWGDPNYQATGLALNTTYYWRVDEISGRMPPWTPMSYAKGRVWEFTTISGSAEPNFPADGTVIPGYTHDLNIWTKLIFIPGATAVEHTGYFNEDYSKVESRHQDANLGPPPYAYEPGWEYVLFAGSPYVPPANQTLVRGTKYYWTVDATDALGNTFAGDIWEFAIQDFKATLPNPPNEATFIETDVLLSWHPGYGDGKHNIFMGTSWEDVNNVWNDIFDPPPEFVATTIEPNILVTGLTRGVKYYWRVDEFLKHPPPFGDPIFYYKGDVWCFTTTPSALNNDGFINLKDYAIPSNYRQKTGPSLPADSHKEELVNYKDLRTLIPDQ